jgi:hypothetical protein
MVEDADCAVESDDEGDDEEGEGNDAEGFAPGETLWVLVEGQDRISGEACTNCNDTGCELPCCSAELRLASHMLLKFNDIEEDVLECIRHPIRDEARHTPLPSMSRNRVKIFVRPANYQSVQHAHRRASPSSKRTYHRALPSAKVLLGCSTLSVQCGFSMNGILKPTIAATKSGEGL